MLETEQHQMIDWWSQTRPWFSNLCTWVLAEKEFRIKTQTKRGSSFRKSQRYKKCIVEEMESKIKSQSLGERENKENLLGGDGKGGCAP